MSTVHPFRIAVPDSVLDDLAERLARTRWPDAELVDDWSQGVPLAYLRDLSRYWAHDYDWRARELALNHLDHFLTEIDGLDIHFLHHRSPHPDALPLILTHGWPGSILEFTHVLDRLIDPPAYGGDAADAFHVVAPSLPGFGFSAKPTEIGWGVERIAAAWITLMARLGYEQYGAQGGDWGSAVTTEIGRGDPTHCVGVHMTLNMGARPGTEPGGADEVEALERLQYYRRWDSGYSTQQATRPQTLGYGLADSPVGQLAWIVEKFWAWTDCDGHPENAIARDELLDNVMLYWVNETATSSARLYWESFRRSRNPTPVRIPAGFGVYPKEIVPPVRRWAEADFANIVHWSNQPKGGHFAALEQPELFVEDVRRFFRLVR